MRRFYFLSILWILGCKPAEEPKFTAALFKTRGEIFDTNSKQSIVLSSTVEIINSKQYQLFKIPVIRLNSEEYPDSLGKAMRALGRKNVNDTLYEVYVYDKVNKLMVSYPLDNFNKARGKVLDATKNLEVYSVSGEMQKSVDRDLGKPTEIVNKGSLQIKKFPLKKMKSMEADSAYYFYNSSLKKKDFNFSKVLDSLSGSKLYKILFISNPFEEKTSKGSTSVPRRESYFEFEPIEVKDARTLEAIIKKFEKDRLTNFK